MATSSTYNTMLSVILGWIDDDISQKAIQDIVDSELSDGHMWSHDGQLLTERFDDDDLGEEIIASMYKSTIAEADELQKELQEYKKAYDMLTELKKSVRDRQVQDLAWECILKNNAVRIDLAKQIVRKSKKAKFLLEDASKYALELSAKIKFDF